MIHTLHRYRSLQKQKQNRQIAILTMAIQKLGAYVYVFITLCRWHFSEYLIADNASILILSNFNLQWSIRLQVYYLQICIRGQKNSLKMSFMDSQFHVKQTSYSKIKKCLILLPLTVKTDSTSSEKRRQSTQSGFPGVEYLKSKGLRFG